MLEKNHCASDPLLSSTRRSFLKGAATVGVAVAAGPAFIRNAFSSSGQLSLLCWAEEVPRVLIEAFTKQTGIKVSTTPFGQNEELINKMLATGGEGFDLCMPSSGRSPQFKELELLAPFDESKLNLDALVPAMMENYVKWWTWAGKLYGLPHCWGSEAISWRNDKTTIEYADLSYGTMWNPEYKGRIQGRPHSLLLGLGLWMDANGQLPSNRMLDSYKDETNMRRVYDQITKFAIEHKSQIKQFWDNADSAQSGLMNNGCVIGQTWDGPVISLIKQGAPVAFMAPQEGAIAWVDGWSLSAGATNTEQAYAWINFLHTPQANAMMADATGYNSVVKGAEAFLSAMSKDIFAKIYPGDAIERLWHRQPEPTWYAEIRNQYAEKLKSA
jgi:spermidine/putrescine transport system substrate-binding protein